MTLYAESSAVLRLAPRAGARKDVAATLADADLVIASDLTLIECDRVLIRAVTLDELRGVGRRPATGAAQCGLRPMDSARLDEEIVERARRPFPAEPVRTLDAIHVASALVARKAVPDLAMLSLDDHVREAAGRLGIPLLPRDDARGI
jgi:hypothetical protein